jgi:C4-dicarboxylate-binding protein DctP
MARFALGTIFTVILLVPGLHAGAVASTTQLRVVLALSSKSWLYQGLQRFKKNVEASTKGEINVTLIASSPVYDGKEVRKAVATGAIEMGAVPLSEFSTDIPAVDIFSQPFMFYSEPILQAATKPKSRIRLLLDEAILHSNGVRVLWWQSAGAAVLASRGGAIVTPADIAGKTVGVPVSPLAQMVKLCSATPVMARTGPDSASAPARLDMSVTSVASVVDSELWNTMTALTVTHYIAQQFIITINEAAWSFLTKDQKLAVQDAAAEAERFMYGEILEEERENMELAAKHGMKVVELTEAQVDLWKGCSSPVLESFIETSGSLGQNVMSGYRQILIQAYARHAQ